MSSTNYSKYMPNAIKKLAGMPNSVVPTKQGYFNSTIQPGMPGLPGIAQSRTNAPSTLWSILSYFIVIVIVLIIILLIIHNFITPIFRFMPGTPGIIPIPGMDDGILYWNNTSAVLIPDDVSLPIHSISSNYSLNIDMFIENPIQISNNPRIIFTRGGVPMTNIVKANTILSVLKTYNLAIALQSDTTDLIVSVLDTNTNSQDIIINNIPIQIPFRLGIVLMSTALEVYLNNKLVKTKTLLVPPKSVTGDIVPSSTLVKMKNLKIWKRVLSTSEIIHATPDTTSASDFGAGPIPSS